MTNITFIQTNLTSVEHTYSNVRYVTRVSPCTTSRNTEPVWQSLSKIEQNLNNFANFLGEMRTMLKHER